MRRDLAFYALRHLGLTMVELLIVIAVLAIAASLAAPSFTDFLAKRRVESIASELITDLQFARSEAVARNAAVRVTLVSGSCYVIHLETAAASCTDNTNSIKTVQLEPGARAAFSAVDSLQWLQFDPVRGTATFQPSTITTGAFDVKSSDNTWQVRVRMTAVGGISTCSPNNSIAGYKSCA
jgi:type IV fimbrial biogenesis protein FimT